MSSFVFFSCLFICKRQWINYLGWGRERANLFAVVYLYLCGFCLERFRLPLGAWDGLRYFILALPEPSINYLNQPPCENWK